MNSSVIAAEVRSLIYGSRSRGSEFGVLDSGFGVRDLGFIKHGIRAGSFLGNVE